MTELLALGTLVLLVGAAALAAVVAIVLLIAHRLLQGAAESADRLTTRARSHGVGRRAEVARLRLTLREEVRAARRTVDVAAAHAWPLGDAPALVSRLERSAATLDAQLRSIDAEPHTGTARHALAAVRPHVTAIARAATELREGVRASGLQLDGAELRGVGADCALEARALRTR